MLKVLMSIIFATSLVLAASANAQMGMGGGVNFTEAAETLGVTEEALVEALGDSRQPDYAAAAEKLGVTEEALLAAVPQRGREGGAMGGGMAQ